MNATEVLRIVDAIHRDKNIDKEIVFEGIEAALVSAAKKHYGEESDIVVNHRPRRRLDHRHASTAKCSTPKRPSAGSAPRPPSR